MEQSSEDIAGETEEEFRINGFLDIPLCYKAAVIRMLDIPGDSCVQVYRERTVAARNNGINMFCMYMYIQILYLTHLYYSQVAR